MSESKDPAPSPGPLRRLHCSLETPAGPLPFIVHANATTGWVENGSERIPIPAVRWDSERLVLDFPHYASRIEATWDSTLEEFQGIWRKRRGRDNEAKVPFQARETSLARFGDQLGSAPEWVGRFRVHFAGEDPALAIWNEVEGGLEGTFLTTTGDYRTLAGAADASRLRLSCFDGAHAFLFHATRDAMGEIAGVFWSGNWWHTTWTAVRDETFTLPDPMELTTWNADVTFDSLAFPDLDGIQRRLSDPAFAGKARIIQVFGSWCPNCHDAALYLRELHERYRHRGLSIVGLAFELTGEFETDREQVVRSIERHGTPYPILVAGSADKATATEQLRALSFVKSYPTTIFLDAEGEVRSIYTGFSGPATGHHYDALRARFEGEIEALLAGD